MPPLGEREYKGADTPREDPVPNPTTKRSLAAVVLAAGKGKRLKSSTPKVLHPLCGRPALWWALQNLKAARPTKIVIVVHHGADQVREVVASWSITPTPVFVEQGEALGTGHAVLQAQRAVGRVEEVLVTAGDFDPVTPELIRELLRVHRRTKSAGTILTTEVSEPGGYARIERDGTRLLRIVEGLDAPPELQAVKEVSLLVFAFRRADLFRLLPRIGRKNSQREYYLNEVFPLLLAERKRISAVKVDVGGVMGINSRADLARSTRILRERINATHLANGVTLIDPETTYIDVDVRIGADTVIQPMTYLEGATRIGAGCEIGPSTRIVDSRVDDGATVTFAVIREARIGRNADVGPFVSIRPGTVLEEGAKAGTFVELKNSRVGRGSKVPHLSYVGDADIGKGVNIGAANVFANYDGYDKNRTVVGDEVRTGSDTILVAPVRLGKGAVTGAGSVITKDVPPGALAVERTEQRIVKGYRKRKDEQARERPSGEHGEGAH